MRRPKGWNMSELGYGAMKCVVVICEEALEPLIGRDIVAGGAKGYTVSTVRGRGVRGVRDAQWLLSSNIRFEILCAASVADSLLQTVYQKYATHYGLVGFVQDVVGPHAADY